MTYLDGRGVLRDALASCTSAGFSVADIESRRLDADGDSGPTVTVRLDLHGGGSVPRSSASCRSSTASSP